MKTGNEMMFFINSYFFICTSAHLKSAHPHFCTSAHLKSAHQSIITGVAVSFISTFTNYGHTGNFKQIVQL